MINFESIKETVNIFNKSKDNVKEIVMPLLKKYLEDIDVNRFSYYDFLSAKIVKDYLIVKVSDIFTNIKEYIIPIKWIIDRNQFFKDVNQEEYTLLIKRLNLAKANLDKYYKEVEDLEKDLSKYISQNEK